MPFIAGIVVISLAAAIILWGATAMAGSSTRRQE